MFNEKAEKLNGRAAMVGFVAAVGSYLATGHFDSQVYGERNVTHSGNKVSTGRVQSFCSLLTDGNVDDDDNGPGGGLMTPAYSPHLDTSVVLYN